MYNLIQENEQGIHKENYIINCNTTGTSMYISLAGDGSRVYSNRDEIKFWDAAEDSFTSLLKLMRRNRKVWAGTGKLTKIGTFNTIEELLKALDLILLIEG